MWTVIGIWLAGIPVADQTARTRHDREARIVALDLTDGKRSCACSRMPDEPADLRSTLLQDHVWRQREGLWPKVIGVNLARGGRPARRWVLLLAEGERGVDVVEACRYFDAGDVTARGASWQAVGCPTDVHIEGLVVRGS